MALIKKIRTKDVIGEHLIVDGAGSVLPLSRVTAATVTINNASVASAEEVVWLNNIDHKQFVAVSGGQYYKDWTEFTYGGITYPPSSIYADKKAKALFRVGKSLMQFSTTDNAFVYILEDDLAQVTEDAHNYTDQKIANLVNGAPDKLNTLDELAAALKDNENIVDTLNEAIGNKVSKEEGKGLSTNDYTTAEKNKVAGIGAGATIEANFNSANVPYNVVLPFSGIETNAVEVNNTSANSPNGIYWVPTANKFAAKTGTGYDVTFHSAWPSFTDLAGTTYPASAYYTRADAKGKLYLKGNVSYAFVAGSLIPVGDGVGGNIDLSNYYTKAQADTNFIKKNGQYVNIGNYVAIGDIDTDNEDHAVEIGTNVNIKHGVSIGQDSVIGKNVRINLADYTYAKGVRINRRDVDDLYSINISKYYDQGLIVIGTEITDEFDITRLSDSISPSLVFGKNVILGSNTIVSGDVSIGNFVSIGNVNANSRADAVLIGKGVTIGKKVNIGDGVTLQKVGTTIQISDGVSINFSIGQGVQIGTKDGNVVIKDNVLIGQDGKNLTIKIDNIGRMAMYSGTPSDGFAIGYRTTLDGDIYIGSNVNIANNINIGENANIGQNVNINSPLTLSLTNDANGTSYLTITDPYNNAVGKIAFVNGDVISTSVVSGDTLTV